MPKMRTLNSSLIVFYLIYKLIKTFQINIFLGRRRSFAEYVKVRVASERHNPTRTRYKMHPIAVEKREIHQRVVWTLLESRLSQLPYIIAYNFRFGNNR